jgi:PAS domain S-box-containing protein/putative nucleotidyltransferase with HDIG domain
MSGSTSGTGTMRVLCLEDSPADAELVRESLSGAVVQLEWDLASDRPGFEELLAAGPYDVILADYSLPGFDAHGALELAKVACPTTPFICVSGTIGEEATVELLKDGADDCVLKDRLGRLPFAVQRSIDERAREAALRLSEEKYGIAFHASPDSITITRMCDGKLVEVNEGYERLMGYTRAESIGKTTVELSAYVNPGARDNLVTRLRETGEVKDFDATVRRKDGTSVAVIVSARVLDFQGEECFLAVAHDITERKRTEEERCRAERFFRDTFEHADVGIAHVNCTDGTWLRVNQRLCDMLGYTREELMRTTFSAITHPDDVEENARHLRRLLAGDEDTYAAEKRYLRKDGSIVWVHMNVALIRKEDGTPDYNITVLTDINDRKQAEEEIVRQRESIDRTLTSVIDIAGDIVELRDPYTAGHQRRVAQLATRIAQDLGMSNPEIADIRVAGLLHDMGKAGVPVEILSKPGAISPQEFALIQGHAEAGYRIAAAANMSESIAELIYQHHERCDGSGYPRGLLCDQMLPGAKLLAVADVVEAMMSHRPYRPALGIEAAMAEIERGAGSLYDSEVSKACIALFRAGGFEFSS